MSELQKNIIEMYGLGYSNQWIANYQGCSVRTVQRAVNKYWAEATMESQRAEEVQPDMVNSPPHYTTGGIETIDFIKSKLTHEEYLGYLRGSALKYLSRLGKKGDSASDAGKAVWYANKLQENL